jgi:hypothetical protein
MSRIDSRHWNISTSRHFQNGRHNTANIQHCPISSKFDMYAWWRLLHKHVMCTKFDIYLLIKERKNLTCNDTPLKFCKRNTAQIQQCSISTSWIDSQHWKNFTGFHFQNGRHNTAKIQGHHYLPTYQILMISDNVEYLRYCGGHLENADR